MVSESVLQFWVFSEQLNGLSFLDFCVLFMLCPLSFPILTAQDDVRGLTLGRLLSYVPSPKSPDFWPCIQWKYYLPRKGPFEDYMINMQDSLDVHNCWSGIFLFHLICVWVGGSCTIPLECRLVLSFYQVGLGESNLIVRLGAKYLYTLSHPSLPVPRNLGVVACL